MLIKFMIGHKAWALGDDMFLNFIELNYIYNILSNLNFINSVQSSCAVIKSPKVKLKLNMCSMVMR